MFIKQLSIKNFRNYENADLKLTKNINIITGNNAQGKTSLIEAIYALSTTKSHRTNKDSQIILFEKEFTRIEAIISEDKENFTLTLNISKKGKIANYNGISKKKLSDYIGILKTVFFAPEDLSLIKAAPTSRRRFLDMEIGQVDSHYIHHLTQYTKILKHRNELLKKFVENDEHNLMLEVLTKQICPHFLYLINKRKWFLSELEVYAKDVHTHITDFEENIMFKYLNSAKSDLISEEEIFKKYERFFQQDKKMKTTTIGPHRDDFLILINDMNAHEFASQGQQRTAILSIKLAEIELINEVTGVYPVLLLDDVLSELDNKRQMKLLNATKERTQTFITTTTIDGIDKEIIGLSDIFTIDNAKIYVNG